MYKKTLLVPKGSVEVIESVTCQIHNSTLLTCLLSDYFEYNLVFCSVLAFFV